MHIIQNACEGQPIVTCDLCLHDKEKVIAPLFKGKDIGKFDYRKYICWSCVKELLEIFKRDEVDELKGK